MPSEDSGQERRNGQQLVLCQSVAQCPVQRCRRHSQTPVLHAWRRHWTTQSRKPPHPSLSFSIEGTLFVQTYHANS